MTPSLTFHDHIGELRRRIAWIVLAVGVGSAIGYVLRTRVIKLIQHPLGAPLFYSSPAGSFNFIIKTASILGFMLALPLIVYHLVRFIEPALAKPMKRSMIVQLVLFSTILAGLGVAFAFFIMVPMSLHFFSTYSSASIKPLISADEYLSYVLNLIVTFAVLFQIPLVMLFINKIKPLRPRRLLKFQRYVVVGAFVLAVVLPFTYDPISQLIMAVPIIFLFYFSVLLIWWANRHVVYPAEPAAAPDVAAPAPPAALAWSQPQPNPQPLEVQPSKTSRRGGGRRPLPVLSAIDLRQPGRRRQHTLRLEPPPGMRVNRLNLIDLSDQS